MNRLAYLRDPHNGHSIVGFNQPQAHNATIARKVSVPDATTVDGVDPRPKPTLTSPKISRDLAQLYDEYNGFLVAKTQGADTFTSLNPSLQVSDGRVLISALAAGSQGSSLTSDLQALGMVNARSTDTLVEGELPIVSIRGLVTLKSLGSASAIYAPELGANAQTAAPNPTTINDPADPFGLTKIKSGPFAKLGTDLARAATEYQAFASSGSISAFTPSITTLPVSGQSVLIQAVASGDVKQLQGDLVQLEHVASC